MRFSDLKQDKGVAGLTILLSLIVMLFVIGLLIMIFSLMGSGMRDATYLSTVVAVVNETFNDTTAITDGSGTNLSLVAERGFVADITSFTIINGTVDLSPIPATNYTVDANGLLAFTGLCSSGDTDCFNSSIWAVSYSYTWSADTSATDVMNDTTSGIANVTDWYPIFIVIGAMVVLILLTVIIITAIRSSGLIAGGSVGGKGRNVGSA